MNTCIEGNVLEELLELLKLEKIEENIFRGQSQDLGFGAVFGGQVLGQALSAAYQTVNETRQAHSLHAYFLRHGDATKPIVYEVDCIRDGKSFTTRRVRAVQNGRAIFSMSASFQIEEPGFEHQDTAPEVRGPEGLESELEMAQKVADRIPEKVRDRILCEKPIEIRPVNPINPFAPEKKEWLLNFLKEKGYSEKLLIKSGLFRVYNKSIFPFFRNRLIFPISNTRNQVIGFGGRTLENKGPKYLNSPETQVFKKKSNLYGIN